MFSYVSLTVKTLQH